MKEGEKILEKEIKISDELEPDEVIITSTEITFAIANSISVSWTATRQEDAISPDNKYYVKIGSRESPLLTVNVAIIDGDRDGDGILNDVDDCPNTAAGTIVDSSGCAIFTLPVDNFTIGAYGESCPNTENGKIEISVKE
ncbi:hypothetical protein IH879_18790, partial [candidate division KSB1 bacterium]|nr:hypothetical protein [candidate division KSB1 bacterium]